MKKMVLSSLMGLVLILLNVDSVIGQTEKVLQSTRSLGEAEFHYDAFYKIVDCGDGIPTMMITGFNESGIKTTIAFDIILKDGKGVTQEIKIPFFYTKQAEMLVPSCGNEKLAFLRHQLKKDLDINSLTTQIKFYSK